MFGMDLTALRMIMQEKCRLAPDRPILAGVSGGPDSLCLVDLLDLLGYPVVAAHVDHALRPDSETDAQFVEQFARQRGYPYTSARLDVPAFARQQHLSIEEAARKSRYTFLFEQAARFNAQAVAVAHTADDQVETVLMHFLRGSGINGLKGMAFRSIGREWGSRLPLVRPLLSTWRQQVLEHCQARGLSPRIDQTNSNPAFFRNRLRLELIPDLQTYNPQIKSILWRMAQTLSGDQAVLETALEQARRACQQIVRGNYISYHYRNLLDLPEGQQRSLLREGMAHLLPNLRDVDFTSIERALNFLRAPSRLNQMDLLKGIYLLIEEPRVFIARWGAPILDDDWPWMQPGSQQALSIPGKVALGGDWRLEARLIDPFQPELLDSTRQDAFQCLLDLDSLMLPLTARTSQPGERVQPLGMDGHSLRLSDYWVNKKLSHRARATWPIVWCGDQPAWLPGYTPGHPFRILPGTRRAAHLILSHPDDEPIKEIT